ncbi:MAG: histidinol-phosphatase [Spirochaetaceae bacterium]|nr:histidinol-phosphatase [Spirochaetaceae bacterium]
MINLHTHTKFCDGKNTAEEMVLAAIEKGFDVLGFSAHSLHPLDPMFYSAVDEIWSMHKADFGSYVNEINRLKEKYSSKIKILLGFEADYFKAEKIGLAMPCKKAYEEFKPDFLIGSVHFINKPDGFYTVDHTAENVEQNLIKLYTNPKTGKIDGKTAVCDYFQAEREMLAGGDFDIWGHPDLIRKRNGVLKFFDESESWYKEQLVETAKAAAKAGVIAEINTGAIFRKAMDDVYPSAAFLEILHEHKVPVCINSDAHSPDALDCAYDRARAAAKKAGYKELVYPGNYIEKL